MLSQAEPNLSLSQLTTSFLMAIYEYESQDDHEHESEETTASQAAKDFQYDFRYYNGYFQFCSKTFRTADNFIILNRMKSS